MHWNCNWNWNWNWNWKRICCNMGCICSRGVASDESVNSQRNKESLKNPPKLQVNSSKRGELDGASNGSTKPRLKSPVQEKVLHKPPLPEDTEKKLALVDPVKPLQRRATLDVGGKGGIAPLSRIVSMPHGIKGEQGAAGWPSWLSSVAAEAIQGWVPRRADSFEKLEKIGQGTYSSVYKARDLNTEKIVALKKVRFVNMDPESVRFMAREISIMRRLDHPNVLKLEGLVTSRMSGSLYLVFEYMEHDLAGLAALAGVRFSEAQIKCYMQQLLWGLEHCHSRGVLHRDIKGSNLLIDNDGILRIADLGLATYFNPNQKQQLTSRVVTLWYRPPELLLGATEYGVAVDLWSSGCILAELFAGKPIMPGRTEVEQLHKIFKLCGSPSEKYWKKSKLPNATIFKPSHPYKCRITEAFKAFPTSSLSLLEVLLAIEPENRGSAASALKSEFFNTGPPPCKPSSLPKYPPSKELDAKRINEEAKRQKAAAASKEHGSVPNRKSSRDSKAMAGQETKLDISSQGHSNPKSASKHKLQEDKASGFPKDLPGGPDPHSERTAHPNVFGYSWNKKAKEDGTRIQSKEVFGLERSGASADNLGSMSTHSRWPAQRSNGIFNRLDDIDRSASSHKQGDRLMVKDSTTGLRGGKKNRFHYSGPLMPPGGNVEDMLKEHERQIQEAVRKARIDKEKS